MKIDFLIFKSNNRLRVNCGGILEYTSDKEALYEHFGKDPILFAYHIGDLDDFFFDHCRWAVLRDSDSRIEEVILIYQHPSAPTVLAFGVKDNFEMLLEEIIPELPDKFFCHHQQKYSPILERYFKREPLGTHNKMRFKGKLGAVRDIDSKKIRRLNGDDNDGLLEFNKRAFPGSYYDPRMLETGKYYGWFEDDRVVSVSGIHVYSKGYKTAVLGNIATAPEYRSRGLAAAVTGRLTKELKEEGLSISLNVKADNVPAVRCYSKIGFEITHEFEESVFSKR